MLLKKISYRIALRLMGFVFVLFLLNGAVFLAADVGNAHRNSQVRLVRTAVEIIREVVRNPIDTLQTLPPPLRERVRILDPQGTVLYAGALYQDVPFVRKEGFSTLIVQGDSYSLLTTPIVQSDLLRGYVQVAEEERFPLGEIPFRAFLYLLVSVAVSGLTFLVGLFFARTSLKPAEEMMERLEQFTQDASHELRTPLASLNSSLDVALKTQTYREGILSAKEDVKELTVLIERLLELARLDRLAVELVEVDLTALVGETVHRLQPQAKEKQVTLVDELKAGVAVKGDSSLLRQVLGNLVMNAIKFNRQNGSVIVRLTERSLTVEDTGIGIREELLPHVFDRFYQADASRANEGYGLGLALVKRIMDLHGWKITVKSKEGEGTTFVIVFRGRE